MPGTAGGRRRPRPRLGVAFSSRRSRRRQARDDVAIAIASFGGFIGSFVGDRLFGDCARRRVVDFVDRGLIRHGRAFGGGINGCVCIVHVEGFRHH